MNKRSVHLKFLSIVLILSLILGYSPGLAAGKSGTINADNTPMRAAAKAKAKVLFTLKAGTEVSVLGIKSGVARVTYKGKTGYVKASALAKAKAAQPVKAQSSGQTMTTTKAATLYKSAKTSSKKLKAVKKGAKVTVHGTSGSWKRVSVSGKSGYMLASAFTAPAQSKGLDMMTTQASKMYQKMSTGAKSVNVKQGTTVEVLSTSGKWSKVKLSGKSGYILSSAFTGTISKKTRMYEKDSTKSKSVALKSGAKVSVLSQAGDWYKVQSGKRKGYVKTSAVTLPGDKPTPTPTPKPTLTPKPTPTPAPTKAQSARKTTVKAYMYQKPSTSAKRVSLKAGSALTILSDDGKWLKVKYRGKLGYVQEKAFASPSATPAPAPTSAPSNSTGSYKKLKSGSKGEAVLKLQQRLEALGYLNSVPNSKYGSSTVSAVKLFQKDGKLKSTGIADNKTQQALYAASAPVSSIRSASLKKGSKGTLVKRLQLRLKAKGFYKGKVSGKFTDATQTAVMTYQTQAGLKADGVAGRATLVSLFSSNAPSYSNQPTPTPKPTQTPKPTTAPSKTPAPTAPPASASKKRRADQVIAAAMSKLGKPYVFGATGPNSYDCSGFTMYAYGTVGVKLPHSAYQQGYNCGTKVTMSQLQRGDLVCWNTVGSNLSSHVGIYLGNGQAIHASSGSGKVVISSITTGYYNRAFSWGRALL